MSNSHYIFNGDLVKKANFSIGINRAMRFGDGLFETIRIRDGKILRWNLHIERLNAGMRYLGIKYSVVFFDELLVHALELLKQNEIFEGAILRIFVYRSGSARYEPSSNQAEVLMETENLEENNFSLNKIGLKIGISETVQLRNSPENQFKTLNSIPYIRAAIERKEKGFDELILKNEAGSLVEGVSSNLFIVKQGELICPPVEDGCVNGVIRRFIMDQSDLFGFKINIRSIHENELLQADEVFFSNAIYGIRWAGAFLGKRYFHTSANKAIAKI